MGLRKIIQNEETSFMYANVSTTDQILVILLRNDSAYSVKLTTESDAVVKWCRNLKKSPQDYITLIQKAVENCAVTYIEDGQYDKKEDVFEIQEGCLIWKQYFPDKNVHGRRGKFILDKKSYGDAVKEVLNGMVSDLDFKATCMQTLSDDLTSKSKELQEAKDLAARCVKEKEDFEKEIYGKCVSLINAKKLRVRQLMSNQPSTSGEQSSVARNILTDTQSSSHSSKSSKSINVDSDGYSSDTDVDDPDKEDADTDEENQRKALVQKQKRKVNINSKPEVPKHKFDSQDDLFNNSLEAELYQVDTMSKKPKMSTECLGKSSKKDTENNNGTKPVNESNKRQDSNSKFIADDTQDSIINQLF